MAKLLWSSTSPGRASFLDTGPDIGVSEPSVGAAFTYRPGEPDPRGMTFASWDDLVTSYLAEATLNPTRPKTIAFDDSIQAVSIPQYLPPGTSVAAALDIVAGTKFTSARPGRQVSVTVANDAVWKLKANALGEAMFQSEQIVWERAAGISTDSWITDSDLGVPATSFKIALLKSQLKNGASAPLYEASTGTPSLDLDMVESAVMVLGTAPVVKTPAGRPLSVRLRAKSLLEQGAVESVGGAVSTLSSEVDTDSLLGVQEALEIPAGSELNGPAASLNVRPSPPLVVLTSAQLKLTGATNVPQILQCFFFGLTANPTNNDALVLTDGTTTETFIFKAAPAGAFQVQIGLTKLLTLYNLAAQITADSALWKGALVQNALTNQEATAIIRKNQTVESYPDRAYTAAPFVSGGPVLGGYRTTAKATKLSYASPVFAALPTGDPGYGIAGFSTVSPLSDGILVSVIDGLTDGIYQALNPVGGVGSGAWNYLVSATDPALVVNASGNFFATRQTRIAVATLTAPDVTTLVLPITFPVGIPLMVRRTDATGGTLTIAPLTGTINGVASITQPVTSGRIYAFDGTNWYSMGGV